MSDVSFYPPRPSPGSNGFGEFAFGVSPFGNISLFNWLDTVISQYANSPIMLALLDSFDSALDQTQNFEMFYDLIWNLDTAVGYGLDVWGRIVGVNRTLEVAIGKYIGFQQQTTSTADTFGPGGKSPFYNGAPVTSNFTLSDMAYRSLIFAKALANICSGSIPAINQILLTLFPGRGDCYVTNGMNMAMTYTFTFDLTPVETAIVFQSGALPTPAGVTATIVIP